MNQMSPVAKIARRTRSAFSRRSLRAATVAGVMVLAVGTAGSSLAATGQHHVRPFGYAPTEECLNWSGTIKYFPALSATTPHAVNAIIQGTLSNCNFLGTQQSFSGSVFGELSGTATKTSMSLSGNVAITWPADANLNPTISPVSITNSGTGYYLNGVPTAGAGTGQLLQASYDSISMSKILGGTNQNILGSAPFGLYVNEG